MTFSQNPCFFHVDLDAFFASVEQLVHPEWKGKPVIVGGLPGDRRAVVSTASYEARKYGVHSAMPLERAVELCPNAIFTRANHGLYSEHSQKIMEIFGEFSPDVKQISIDEAFLDMTGTERLFGNAEECALKLKREVFERSGLTVSVGVATTNYIAKICSGLKKPDGLCIVAPGDEEKFMLELPLEKVWGVGKKSLERLKAAGFNTTKDIKSHSLKLLESVFGQAQAAFLYNVVRGIEPPGFLEESQSHSSSIESTYDYDLTENTQIERAILDLSERLMFRLLKQNATGKTVSVKIRYDDFHTVNAQNTSAQNVTSVDDLYSRAMKIFRSKYQAGRAIRLLGISVNNTTDADSEKQNELFDFGQSKRKALEKAILKISQKNPQVQIHKARLLDAAENPKKRLGDFKGGPSGAKSFLTALFFTAILTAFPCQPAFSEDTKTIEASGSGPMVVGKDLPPPEISEGTTLFERQMNDKRVEFIAQGYWDAKLKETISATFGFGKELSISAGTPAFIQQVDMSLNFWLDKKWYVNAAFADEFNKNTYAVGYTNGDGCLKDFRVANRKIVFPSSYSVDDVNRGIGGGENQAPGAQTSFADPDGKWTFDAAFRYDMLSSRDKTYYGKNSVNDANLAKNAFQTGRIYVLPTFESAAAIQAVYVESYGGSYSDECGRKYKKLSESDYLVVASRKTLVLSQGAGAAKKGGVLPAVALAFFSPSDEARCFSELGNFGTNSLLQRGSGFLGDVQEAFGFKDDEDNDNRQSVPNVASFSYSAKSGAHPVPDPSGSASASIDSCGFFGKISGQRVLFVQHPAGFSPFSSCFRYDLGINPIDEIAVVHQQSEKTAQGWTAVLTDDDLALTENNFFSERRFYADVYSNQTKSSDYANAQIRYPFCAQSPGAYLGYPDSDDIVLRSRNYTPVNRFDIGTDAVGGTVIVYKNGVIDSGAKYNSETGEVTLSGAVGASDKVYIVWYEDSKSFDSGSIALAAGFKYNWTKKFWTDVSASGRWTLALEKQYAEAGKSYFGYGALASKAAYQGEAFGAGNTISGTVENKNTSGYYKLLSFDESAAKTFYNAQNAGKNLPQSFAPRLNPRPSDSSGQAVELESLWNCSLQAQNGSSDKSITGFQIPIQWNWSGNENEWASNTVSISGQSLSGASTFSVALKTPDSFNGDVYLQLGVNADENFESEAIGSVPTWKISESGATDVLEAFDPSIGGSWQIAKVLLKDQDRSQCVQYKNARIIVKNSGQELGSKILYWGPYEIASQGIFTVQDQDITVTTIQSRAANPGASRFNNASNYAQEIDWMSCEETAPENSKIIAYKYFEEVDSADYSEINMYFKGVFDGSKKIAASDFDYGMTFVLDSDSQSASQNGKIAVFAAISKQALESFLDGSWHLLTIDKSQNALKIDGNAIAPSERKLFVNSSVIPSRVKIEINTSSKDYWNERGSFFIDEIYFSKTSPHFIVQDKNYVNYDKSGVLLETKNGAPVLSDVKASLSSAESLVFYTQQERENNGDISADAALSFTAGKILFDVSAAHASGSGKPVTNASHKIASSSSLFKVFDFGEEFNFDNPGKSVAKANSAKIDLKAAKIPVILSAEAKSDSSEWSVNTKAQNSMSMSFGKQSGGCSLKVSGEASQKALKSSGAKTIDSDNYFYSWWEATAKEFSFGDSAASKRKIAAKIESVVFLPWSSLAPRINFCAEENYAASKNFYHTDKNEFLFAFPFKINKNAFEISWKKTDGGVSLARQGGDYSSDAWALFSAYGEKKYFFAAPPIYDLISENLSQNIHSKTKDFSQSDNLQSEFYSGEYAFSFKRPIYANKMDFFVPTSAALSFARDIRAAQSLSDAYQAKAKLGWTAFNIFGKNGSLPIAKWFKRIDINSHIK